MATAINRLESHIFGKSPSQPETNPKNVSTMTLKSEKKVAEPKSMIPKDKSEEHIEKELEKEGGGANISPKEVNSDFIMKNRSNISPFPSRLEKPSKSDKENEILEMFKKVKINISLLDAIKQVPRYARFLKDLCVNRR